MEVGQGSRKALEREQEIGPAASDTIAPKRPLGPKKVDKQSLDYVLRTGLAGGLAACAVSLPSLQAVCRSRLTYLLGEDSSWTP